MSLSLLVDNLGLSFLKVNSLHITIIHLYTEVGTGAVFSAIPQIMHGWRDIWAGKITESAIASKGPYKVR